MSASAEIYRWRNSNGQMHYSSSPPQHTTGPIEVKRNNRWYPYTDNEVNKNDPSRTKNNAPITYTTSSPGPSMSPPQIEPAEAVVPYSKQESMIIIQVTINQKISRPFAVDTGATYTVISPEIAEALYLRPNPSVAPITVQTANGQIQVPIVKLDSVMVGGLETPNITAAIHKFHDSSNISGLLGLNFLKRFQMTVDSTHNQLILKPIHDLPDYTNRDCVTARELLSYGQTLRDNSEKEASYYRRAILLCHDLVEAYYYLGTVYIHQKDAQKAIDLHRKLIGMQPNEPEAYFRLGVSYMLQGDFQQAQREFQHALRLEPNHKQAKEYLERLKSHEIE